MMGRQRRDQGRLFSEFRLEDRIPENHLLRRINVFVTVALGDLHKELEPHYSNIGRPSVDPELMIRMFIVGYCYGIRLERKLCQEVACIWRVGGSANSTSTTRFRITRLSLPTVSAASTRAIFCVTSSSGWCGRPWRWD
jgi:transposase